MSSVSQSQEDARLIAEMRDAVKEWEGKFNIAVADLDRAEDRIEELQAEIDDLKSR